MKIVVAIKQIPSLADELELNAKGNNLDFDMIDFVLNEFDEQALEAAVLLKEEYGGSVEVVGVDLIEELDQLLHTALAKGADSVSKIVGDWDEPDLDSHTHARLLADAIRASAPDLILTGVQAADDLDGQIGPMLAAHLGLPYVGVVTHLGIEGNRATVRKEYSGGVLAEMQVIMPAVVGVQAASSPPRYAPVSRIRQMAKSATITEIEAETDGASGLIVRQMAKPVSAGHAEMIEGGPEEVAGRIIEIIKGRGLI